MVGLSRESSEGLLGIGFSICRKRRGDCRFIEKKNNPGAAVTRRRLDIVASLPLRRRQAIYIGVMIPRIFVQWLNCSLSRMDPVLHTLCIWIPLAGSRECALGGLARSDVGWSDQAPRQLRRV